MLLSAQLRPWASTRAYESRLQKLRAFRCVDYSGDSPTPREERTRFKLQLLYVYAVAYQVVGRAFVYAI